ncbi:MAG: hypothetical protein EBY32_17110, partial [Proteobacteria bacterium]|nr:hypothetical protein [Pseudomonadota bacterium]
MTLLRHWIFGDRQLAALSAVVCIKRNVSMPTATCDLIECCRQLLKRFRVSVDRQRGVIGPAQQIATLYEGQRPECATAAHRVRESYGVEPAHPHLKAV